MVVVAGVSCSASKKAQQAKIPVDKLPQILREASHSKGDSAKSTKDDVKLHYKNKSTSVTIPIDPQRQDFVLKLKGLEKKQQQKSSGEAGKQHQDSTIMQDSLVQATMAKHIKQVLRYFRRAQDLFYREDFKGAMEMVNRSLEIQRTADALGLKGSIFFMQDNMSSAKYYWNKAVRMDPEIPVPDIPELESIIKKIKAEDQQEVAQ